MQVYNINYLLIYKSAAFRSIFYFLMFLVTTGVDRNVDIKVDEIRQILPVKRVLM